MVNHPVDLVCVVYRQKKEHETYAVNYLNKPELWADPETGLLEVKSVPTGFLKLSRACIGKMIEAYPDKHFYTSDRDQQFYPLFDHVFEDGY